MQTNYKDFIFDLEKTNQLKEIAFLSTKFKPVFLESICGVGEGLLLGKKGKTLYFWNYFSDLEL
jgi:hypothetical protein